MGEHQSAWRKSSYRNGSAGSCVELAHRPGVVPLRDSKNPGGTALAFPGASWPAFSPRPRAGGVDAGRAGMAGRSG
ncbi:DUF397 domain-containing protein [Goodfellowiella coeruleoviolacea]|uniref:DUF397 domain-containing protein n=1 Tax=Goodfellowiella coeruleoviolacea TaxID=334858 RepID=UPI0020A52729|nr:DUF397 domain-containing protein [Goodfellowiella coeruleoviolacea]